MALVTLSSEGLVRVITLNVPDKLNALSRPLLDEFKAAVESIASDADARAVVVTGAGRAFSAGADLGSLFGDRTRPVEVLSGVLREVYASFLGLYDLTIPTIASVHGPAVGAGLNIALACDLIIAGPDASFVPSFSRIGLLPGGGCHWLLTHRIGAANTLAALYAGDPIGAQRALALGVAQEVLDDPLSRARELAADLAGREPSVMSEIKRIVRVAPASDLATVIEQEAMSQARSLTSATFEQFAQRFA